MYRIGGKCAKQVPTFTNTPSFNLIHLLQTSSFTPDYYAAQGNILKIASVYPGKAYSSLDNMRACVPQSPAHYRWNISQRIAALPVTLTFCILPRVRGLPLHRISKPIHSQACGSWMLHAGLELPCVRNFAKSFKFGGRQSQLYESKVNRLVRILW